jgi:hypothetical protein
MKFLRSVLHALATAGLIWCSLPATSAQSAKEMAAAPNQSADSPNADLQAAIAGLSAPTGMDFVAFGHALLAGMNSAPFEELFDRLAGGKPKLVSNIPIEMECWRVSVTDGLSDDTLRRCDTPAALATFIARNRELLERHRRLRQLEGVPALTGPDGMAMLNIGGWTALDVANALQSKRPEEAWQKWQAQQAFVVRHARGPNYWIDKAIALVNEGSSRDTLDMLMIRAPKTADAHRDELLAMFKPGDFSRYGLADIFRIENDMIPGFTRDLGIDAPMAARLRKRFEAYTADMAASLLYPEGDIAGKVTMVRRRHAGPVAEDAGDEKYFTYWQRIFESARPMQELLKSMQHKEAQRRLLTLRLMIDKAGIADSDVAAMINDAPPALRSPYDGKPPVFSREKRSITFNRSGEVSGHDFLAVQLRGKS